MIHREVIEHRLTKNPHDASYAIMLCKLAIKELDKIGKIFQEAFDECEQDIAEGRAFPKGATPENILAPATSTPDEHTEENGRSARSSDSLSTREAEGALDATSG